MLELLHNGEPTPEVAEQTIAILKKPKGGFIDKALPEETPCANKPGWVDRAMCDAAIVYLPRSPYILAIMTKYGLCDRVEQENFIISCAQTIHETMAARPQQPVWTQCVRVIPCQNEEEVTVQPAR